MKGIVLAGGTGSRLFPLTKVTNKHLLPVGHYPMIYHPIAKLAEAGLDEILVVTGTEHMGAVVGVLGSGSQIGVQFSFRVQDEAGGIAQALELAKGFVGDESCVVILGDNIFEDSIVGAVNTFRDAGERGARILLKEVDDPQRFGVAEVVDGRVVDIEEKPTAPKSNFAVTGVYMYDSDVFAITEDLEPSGRGELEITDVNNAYVAAGTLGADFLNGWWTDAGTFPSLSRASALAQDVVLSAFEGSAQYKPNR